MHPPGPLDWDPCKLPILSPTPPHYLRKSTSFHHLQNHISTLWHAPLICLSTLSSLLSSPHPPCLPTSHPLQHSHHCYLNSTVLESLGFSNPPVLYCNLTHHLLHLNYVSFLFTVLDKELYSFYHARSNSANFVSINSFNHYNPVRQILSFSSFYRWNRGTHHLEKLAEVTQSINWWREGRGKIQTQAVQLYVYLFPSPHTHCLFLLFLSLYHLFCKPSLIIDCNRTSTLCMRLVKSLIIW